MLVHYAITLLVTAVTHFILAIIVYLKGSNRLTSITYALYSLSIAWWSSLQAIAITRFDAQTALFWWRVNHAGVIFIPIFFVHFVMSLLENNERIKRKRFIEASYLTGLIFLALDTTPLLINEVAPKFSFRYFINPGPVYHVFFALWVAWAVYGLFALFRIYFSSSGIKRTQLIYFCWSMFVAYIGGIPNFLPTFNIEVPYVMPFGTYAIPLYAFATSYAIIRHQLLDIGVVIKRTLVFAGLAGSVVGVVSLMTFVTQDLLVRYVAIPKFWGNIFAAGIIAAVYGRLRNWLVNVTDRYLFQKQYDYKELLKRFMGEVQVGIRDLRQLVQMTVTTLTDTMKLESCSLLLLNRDSRQYELIASKGLDGQRLKLDDQEPFIAFLRRTHEPIGVEGELGKVRFPEAVTDRLKQLRARVCLPLLIHEELVGVLCLGKKKSDEEFAKDDLDILSSVAGAAAIAISNAQVLDELAKTQAEAAQKEKLAVIGTLSAGINHEICNPLGIVKSQCEAFLLDLEDGLLKDKPPAEVVERAATIMNGTLKQIDRATAITQKLSSFAKPIKEPTAQPVSVANEVDEVLTLVGHDLKLEKIEVRKEISSDLPPIVVDRRQLQEVLFNLIRNAAQAIQPPGSITIRAGERSEGQVRIEIEDTGSGIPPEKLGKIYDPFFTTKEPGKGTGLGLFIVRQIVERNKGRISVESAVGKGTTFFLDFPAAMQAVVRGATTR